MIERHDGNVVSQTRNVASDRRHFRTGSVNLVRRRVVDATERMFGAHDLASPLAGEDTQTWCEAPGRSW